MYEGGWRKGKKHGKGVIRGSKADYRYEVETLDG